MISLAVSLSYPGSYKLTFSLPLCIRVKFVICPHQTFWWPRGWCFEVKKGTKEKRSLLYFGRGRRLQYPLNLVRKKQSSFIIQSQIAYVVLSRPKLSHQFLCCTIPSCSIHQISHATFLLSLSMRPNQYEVMAAVLISGPGSGYDETISTILTTVQRSTSSDLSRNLCKHVDVLCTLAKGYCLWST